jgi:hypothetical protein
MFISQAQFFFESKNLQTPWTGGIVNKLSYSVSKVIPFVVSDQMFRYRKHKKSLEAYKSKRRPSL